MQHQKYKKLFGLKLYHLYFLNDGTKSFLTMTSAEKQLALDKYHPSDFMRIYCTVRGELTLQGQQIIWRILKDELQVLIRTEGDTLQPFIPLDADFELYFLIALTDPYFEHYSVLQNRQEQCYYFSNTNDFFQPGFKTVSTLSGAVLADDSQILSPENRKSLSLKLSEDLSNNWAVVHFKMRTATEALSVLKANEEIKDPAPDFALIIDNRKTFWRYKNMATDAIIFTTADKKPLTRFGRIPISNAGKSYPNPSPKQQEINALDYYSITYI